MLRVVCILLGVLSSSVWAAESQTTGLEIEVWGESAVRVARADVVHEMRELGYRPVDQSGGRVLFLPPSGTRWVGRVWLESEGELRFVRPLLTWKGLEEASWIDPEPAPTFSTDRPPLVGQTGWVVWPSMKVLGPSWSRVREALEPWLETYRSVMARTALEERLQAIPDRLDRFWEAGEALDGSTLEVPESARRAALLNHWALLPSTPEGLKAMRLVEGWLEENLADTEHALTVEERQAVEAQRADGRGLGDTLR